MDVVEDVYSVVNKYKIHHKKHTLIIVLCAFLINDGKKYANIGNIFIIDHVIEKNVLMYI